jgi:TolB-like protein/Tfp pilus assembly protein PilF
MFTDMVGYSALGQRNESLSLALVEEQERLIRPILVRHNGREIKTMGDAFLVEFPSALDAVRCAYDIQRTTKEFNISLPEDRRVRLRIGVHLGDVVESQGDISGDAVNVASRIEALAEEGGVCLTRQVYDHVQNKFELSLTSLGPKPLKNVNTPIEVYKMVMPWDAERTVSSEQLSSRRIAVLPFANMSAEPADEYFADGMTEELITSLSGLRELTVIARTSVMKYKASSKGASEIAKELKAGTLIEGSVRKAGSRVRITVQLIDSQTEGHIWSQNYDKQFDDIFAIQSEIAERVAKELKIQLFEPEAQRLEKKPTASPEAYTLYLKGRYYWSERTQDGLKKALEYFQKAIDLDPAYARAYSGLADTYSIMAFQSILPGKEAMGKAKRLAERALELDDTLAEAHTSLGYVHDHFFDWSNSEREYTKAIELSPSYATAHFWYSILLMWTGRHDKAIESARQAEELDPLSPAISTALGQAILYARRYDDAIAHLEKKVRTDPDSMPAHFILGIAYFYKGLYERAAEEERKALAISTMQHRVQTLLGMALVKMGKEAEAREILASLQKSGAQSTLLAILHTELGEKERAIELLEKAYREREPGLGWISVVPSYDALRSDPRFGAILRGMNLAS